MRKRPHYGKSGHITIMYDHMILKSIKVNEVLNGCPSVSIVPVSQLQLCISTNNVVSKSI